MQTDAQKISKMNKKFAFARFHQNGKFVQRISLIAYFVKFLMQMVSVWIWVLVKLSLCMFLLF